MGFFDFFKEKNTNPEVKNNSHSSGTGLNLSKEDAVTKLNLRKENLTKLCMTKSELTGISARVAVVMDYSLSMSDYYRKGLVQDLVERLLPMALKFDDNGELDIWLFDDKYRRLPSVTQENFYGFIDNEVIKKSFHMGGTKYAPVMKDIVEEYVNNEPLDYPSFVIFITDGDNFDKSEAEMIIKKASKHNIFWQFVGIGDGRFDFLVELDKMDGRFIDNANFFAVDEIHSITDDDLYKKLLSEYPSWEKKARELGLI